MTWPVWSTLFYITLAPLLPGHGTLPSDLNTKHWPDWVNQVNQALDKLKKECRSVFVGGLSLGALLSIFAAANDPSIKGVVACSPPLPLAHPMSFLTPLKYVLPSWPKPKDYFADHDAKALLWNYDVAPLRAYFELVKFTKVVRAALAKVQCPILVVHSTMDSMIHQKSPGNILNGVSSTDKELLTLHKSGHVVTLDTDWKEIAERIYSFIKKRESQDSSLRNLPPNKSLKPTP